MLHIKNFRKEYAGHLAISVPDLQFEEGIYWIKGANGSGKSTLFKSIAGLQPYEGEIILNDEINQRQSPIVYRKLVNYTEAEPIYPNYLSGVDLISFVAEAKNAPKDQVQELIQILDIESFVKNQTGSYSSGMLKKLSLVLGFLGNPKLVILDEPLITLDTTATAKIGQLILKYHEKGVGFLLSSHQSKEIDELPIKAQYLVENQSIHKI
ncbi:MAG: ATP-binding cassette domain-containing protein [Cytophagales bacterium]